VGQDSSNLAAMSDGAVEPMDEAGASAMQYSAPASGDANTAEQISDPGVPLADIPIISNPSDDAQGVTAYFVFANVHRESVKASLQADVGEAGKVTIGMIGKKIGQLWKSCPDSVKEAYGKKAKQVWQCVASTWASPRFQEPRSQLFHFD
jgi:hypothetical protein